MHILQILKLLFLTRVATLTFSSVEDLSMFYFTSIRSRLEYASVARNILTSTDANQLERNHRKFFPCAIIISQIRYRYANDLDHQNFYALATRRRHTDALFSLMFLMVLNVVLPCLKLLAYAHLFEILWILICLQLASHVKFIAVLDEDYLQILFIKTLIYL